MAAHTFALDADGRASLKKLYREAAQLCHPDRVAEDFQAAATHAFQQVQHAYQHQDLAALHACLLHLRQGRFTAAPTQTSVERLQLRRDALAAHHAQLLHELTALRAAEAFALAQADEVARAAYLATNRTVLEAERDRLTAQHERLRQQAASAEVV